jgi:hypothetical protein
MDTLGRPAGAGAGTMISAPSSAIRETQNPASDFIPESRKRKIEEVDGRQPDDRARLGLQFHHNEGTGISPSSYRTYSDFPRSTYPQQMPAPATAGQLRQSALAEEENPLTKVSTVVKVPTMEQFGDHVARFSVNRVRPWRLERDGGRQPQHAQHATKLRRCSNWSQPPSESNLVPIPVSLFES